MSYRFAYWTETANVPLCNKVANLLGRDGMNFSAPVYDLEGNIVGYGGSTYETEDFKQVMESDIAPEGFPQDTWDLTRAVLFMSPFESPETNAQQQFSTLLGPTRSRLSLEER